jgi:hypothetical protein
MSVALSLETEFQRNAKTLMHQMDSSTLQNREGWTISAAKLLDRTIDRVNVRVFGPGRTDVEIDVFAGIFLVEIITFEQTYARCLMLSGADGAGGKTAPKDGGPWDPSWSETLHQINRSLTESINREPLPSGSDCKPQTVLPEETHPAAGPSLGQSAQIVHPYPNAVKKFIDIASRHAKALRQNYLGSEHMLLAALECCSADVRNALESRAVTSERLIAQLKSDRSRA